MMDDASAHRFYFEWAKSALEIFQIKNCCMLMDCTCSSNSRSDGRSKIQKKANQEAASRRMKKRAAANIPDEQPGPSGV